MLGDALISGRSKVFHREKRTLNKGPFYCFISHFNAIAPPPPPALPSHNAAKSCYGSSQWCFPFETTEAVVHCCCCCIDTTIPELSFRAQSGLAETNAPQEALKSQLDCPPPSPPPTPLPKKRSFLIDTAFGARTTSTAS